MMDYLKSAAMNFISPKKKPQMNPTKPDMYGNPTYRDLNRNGIDPILRPKRAAPNLLNPAKDSDKDISKDKYGNYVSTITYPLPPVGWEKKQYDRNKKMRNGRNNYI